MKKYIPIFLLTGLLAFFSSCETDFVTTADYQDITVIYGLIDSRDSVQNIKINRAFLTEKNVMTYAAERDSNEYLYKLDVTIEEWTPSGDKVNTYILDTTTVYDKEPGEFYYPEQTIYRWPKPNQPHEIKYIVEGLNDTVGIEVFWLNEDNHYKLNITNPENGNEITAETPIVKDFRIVKPGFAQTIRFVTEPINPREFEWEKADNGAEYEFELRFNYGEWRWSTNDTVYKYILLAASNVGGSAGNTLSYFYWDDQFYVTCGSLIPYSNQSEEDDVRERYTSFVDIVVSVAEDNYALYREVNAPSTSIVQERPNYTNVENGIGIFSSRYRKVKTKKLHSESVSDLKDIHPELKFKF